jgi:hypothetical protein
VVVELRVEDVDVNGVVVVNVVVDSEVTEFVKVTSSFGFKVDAIEDV